MIEKMITKEDLNSAALMIIEKINKLNSNKAIVLALLGDLGAGKTTITKEIAKILGIKENISSPTFVIMKKYNTKNNKFKKLIHIDAYRLEKEDEITNIGWDSIIKDKDNLIIIEWPEKVLGFLDKKDTFFVSLEHIDDKTRKIKI